MADSVTLTGCRDDVVVDTSRCLRMRFSDSRCRHCSDICPQGAVSLDSGLAINPETCRGCLLCTSVCPVGALEQSADFSTCLAKLSRVPEPVLGCILTKECSNAIVACLGGLSEEHLLSLYHTLTGSLTLNASLCSHCTNGKMIARLRQRLDTLISAQLTGSNCSIVIAESAQDIKYRDEPVGRRGFFRSVRSSLFASAAVMLSHTSQHSERRTGYAEKRVPGRRELLNRSRSEASQELEDRLHDHFDSYVAFDDTCSSCQGCVAICPTGALQTLTADDTPAFEHLHCTGCGLCQEFCLDEAIRIYTGDKVK